MISRRRPQSFSLVEMLVALAILGVMITALLEINMSLLNTWQFDQARNERRTTGQEVFDRMSRDLRQAALPLSHFNTTSLELVINPSGISTTYEFPQAFFWQAPVATDGGTNGNLAVVGYFVQWVTQGSSATPCLSRLLINPSSAAYYNMYSNPTSWITDTILLNNAPSTAASQYVGLVSENVLGLWVQALDPQGNPIQQSSGVAGENFDSRLGYSYTSSVYTSGTSANVASVLPAAMQIAIVVIDSNAAQHLTGTEKPTALTGKFWNDVENFYTSLPAVIKKGAEIQTTTVGLVNGPR